MIASYFVVVAAFFCVCKNACLFHQRHFNHANHPNTETKTNERMRIFLNRIEKTYFTQQKHRPERERERGTKSKNELRKNKLRRSARKVKIALNLRIEMIDLRVKMG